MKDSIEESCELFINGNLDLAIENNLNGVHFPEKYQINEYQNKENLILGRSIHENTDLNKHQKKFDYFHLGPIFLTQSHPNQNTIKEKNISYISRKLSNVIFVGGININNVSKLLKYNFSGIAIMRELLLSRSPEKTFMELREKINE